MLKIRFFIFAASVLLVNFQTFATGGANIAESLKKEGESEAVQSYYIEPIIEANKAWPEPWNDTPPKDTKTISFSGCAFYYSYELGVAYYLKENVDLTDINYIGVSSGTFPALYLSGNFPIEKMKSFSNSLLTTLQSHMTRSFCHINSALSQICEGAMEEKTYEEVSKGLLRIYATSLFK